MNISQTSGTFHLNESQSICWNMVNSDGSRTHSSVYLLTIKDTKAGIHSNLSKQCLGCVLFDTILKNENIPVWRGGGGGSPC